MRNSVKSLMFIGILVVLCLPVISKANLLSNPGFEDADPCDPNEPNEWNFVGGSNGGTPIYYIDYVEGDPTYAHTGDDYVALDVVSDAWTIVYQSVPAAEGISYRLSAWARASASTMPAPTALRLEFRDWFFNWIRIDVLDFDATWNWTQYTLDSNGPAPYGTRYITVAVLNEEPNQVVYYDDMTLEIHPSDLPLNECEQAQFDWSFEFLDGDFDHDCYVDFYDFSYFASYWLATNCYFSPDECGYADFYPSNYKFPPPPYGIVDFHDLEVLLGNWLETSIP